MAAYALPTELLPPRTVTVYQYAKQLAPADNTQIGPYAGLYVGGTGDVVVCMRNGDGAGGVTTVKFSGVPAGTLLPIAIQGVNATGTTATLLLGLG